LILPIISFLFSMLTITEMVFIFDNKILKDIILSFVKYNAITVVFLLIYYLFRDNHRHNKQIEKMSISDL
jgi:hypothetical protein